MFFKQIKLEREKVSGNKLFKKKSFNTVEILMIQGRFLKSGDVELIVETNNVLCLIYNMTFRNIKVFCIIIPC